MIDTQMRQRLTLALAGGLAGLCLHTLSRMMEFGTLGERSAMALIALALVFFTGILAMAGALRLGRAALVSAAHAVLVALLLYWASLRYGALADFLDSPTPFLTALVLTFVPMPFAVAALTAGWRHYPTLFTEAWGIVIRYAAAWLFAGLVWLVLFASDTMLQGVGLTFIGELLDEPAFGFALTGAVLGLAIAVVNEMADVVSPYLVLRLLRLLLPPVLLVMVIFVLALPVSGTVRLFGSLSVAATLLCMAALGAALVTAALDQTPEEATKSALVLRSAQGMAVLLIAPAVLGAWAIWLRVDQYGWTPDRVLGASIAALAIGYGGLYLQAVLRGGGWQARIRQANISMALALVVLSAALLTPVLSPEAISARSQLARFEAGKIPAAELDLSSFDHWGRAGVAARARLAELASQPGQEALAERLARGPDQLAEIPEDISALRAQLAAILPLRPAEATDIRDSLLQNLTASELRDWILSCRNRLAGGQPACVMVVADLWADLPGAEAVMARLDETSWLRVSGYANRDGVWEWFDMRPLSGRMPNTDEAAAKLLALQDMATPVLKPLPGAMLDLPGDGWMMAR